MNTRELRSGRLDLHRRDSRAGNIFCREYRIRIFLVITKWPGAGSSKSALSFKKAVSAKTIACSPNKVISIKVF